MTAESKVFRNSDALQRSSVCPVCTPNVRSRHGSGESGEVLSSDKHALQMRQAAAGETTRRAALDEMQLTTDRPIASLSAVIVRHV